MGCMGMRGRGKVKVPDRARGEAECSITYSTKYCTLIVDNGHRIVNKLTYLLGSDVAYNVPN